MRINRGVCCVLLGAVLIAVMPESPRCDLPEGMASIEVDANKVEGTISPMLYGQFVEVKYGGVKGGLHAELIRNRGFEEVLTGIGLPGFWQREPDDRNEDPAMSFRWDDSVFYPVPKKLEKETVDHSLRIDISQKDGQRRGISQGRIPVREGIEYQGYVWLKSRGFDGYVRVVLEADWTDGETYAAADIGVDSSEWKKYEFRLRPRKADPLGKFGFLLYGKGRIWIDQVSLIPGDSVNGARADVFERAKALRPSFVRWPGGNLVQDYHWMWGIGPRDERTTWTNFSWGNEREPSDFGTDEFLQFCQNLHAEPSIVVNVEGRGATAEEAAAWVEYVNGPPDSKYGALRVANGHPKPYGVKCWEIGNEIYGDWVRGRTDAETYGRNYNRYCAAMRSIDSPIKFIAVGDNDLDWNRTVLRVAGQNIDYLAVHHYYGLREMHGDPQTSWLAPFSTSDSTCRCGSYFASWCPTGR